MDDAFRDTAHQGMRQPAATVSADREQVDVILFCIPHNFHKRNSFLGRTNHRQTLVPALAGELGQFLHRVGSNLSQIIRHNPQPGSGLATVGF